MINIEKYLDSGIIENYCLGLASPEEVQQLEAYCTEYEEIRTALEEAQEALENYVWEFEKTPPAKALDNILANIQKDTLLDGLKLSENSGKINRFIPISAHSDYRKWQNLTRDLKPPKDFYIHTHELYNDSKNALYVVWIKDRIPEEEHDDLLESVLLLEGDCEGILENDKVFLTEGDFWQVPLHTNHQLKVCSNHPVKLILTRQVVA